MYLRRLRKRTVCSGILLLGTAVSGILLFLVYIRSFFVPDAFSFSPGRYVSCYVRVESGVAQIVWLEGWDTEVSYPPESAAMGYHPAFWGKMRPDALLRMSRGIWRKPPYGIRLGDSACVAAVSVPAEGSAFPFTYFGIVIPVWAPAALAGAAAVFVGLSFLRTRTTLRRQAEGRCVVCGYDLRGDVTGRCPECGTDIENPSRRRLDR